MVVDHEALIQVIVGSWMDLMGTYDNVAGLLVRGWRLKVAMDFAEHCPFFIDYRAACASSHKHSVIGNPHELALLEDHIQFLEAAYSYQILHSSHWNISQTYCNATHITDALSH